MSLSPLVVSNNSKSTGFSLQVTGHRGTACVRVRKQFNKNKVLEIFLKIIREDNENLKNNDPDRTLWGIQGEVRLKEGKNVKIHTLSEIILPISVSRVIGSWDYYYEKENYENCRTEIPPEHLESLRNTPILTLSSWQDDLEISSLYLKYVKE